jgi:hypothetical protein
VTGGLAGLFGVGGGGLIVPVLYEVFRVIGVPEDVRMQLCIGTSLAIIVPTTVRSYIAHKARGAVIPHILRIWALPAMVGVATGSITAAFAPALVFKVAFVIFTGFVGAKMLFGRASWNLGTQLPGRVVLMGYGFVTGLFFVTGRGERRSRLERCPHVLWAVHAAGGSDFRRNRSTRRHRRNDRLCVGGVALYAASATTIDRLRVADRVRVDGASV